MQKAHYEHQTNERRRNNLQNLPTMIQPQRMTFHERAREKHDDHGYTPTKNVSLGESEKQMKEQQPEEKSDKTKDESAAEQDIVGATQAESSVSGRFDLPKQWW